jgi:hypothetical protein
MVTDGLLMDYCGLLLMVHDGLLWVITYCIMVTDGLLMDYCGFLLMVYEGFLWVPVVFFTIMVYEYDGSLWVITYCIMVTDGLLMEYCGLLFIAIWPLPSAMAWTFCTTVTTISILSRPAFRYDTPNGMTHTHTNTHN